MRRSGKCLIASIIVISIFMGGCSLFQKTPDNEGLKESTKVTVIDTIKENDSTIEHELIGQIMGGIFYTFNNNTTNEDKEYTEIRKDSIELFCDTIVTVAKDAFLVTDGFEKYEKMLFEHMDTIGQDPNGTVFKITEGILANRTAMRSCQEQIEKFMSTDPQEEISKAAINMYIFEATSELVNKQKYYLSWLMGSTEVAFVLLEETDSNKAGDFITCSADTYSKEINEHFKNMLKGYHQAAKIYTYILSADYHAGEYYLNKIKEKLAGMEEHKKEDIKEIIQYYNDILKVDRKLPIIIEVPSDKITSHSISPKKSLLPFTSVVYAAENGYDKYYSNIIALMLLKELQIQIISNDWERSFEETFLEDILLNTDLSNDIRENYESQISNPINPDVRRRILQEIHITETNGDDHQEVDRISQEVKLMENTSRPDIDRENIIRQITTGQSALAGLEIAGDDFRFSMILTLMNALIKESGNLDGEKIKNISNLINNDLEEMLGDKKGEFIKQITTIKAEELLNIFDEWKKNTINLSTFNLNKDDLINLVRRLGLEITPSPAGTPSATIQAAQTNQITSVETTKPPQPVTKGYWELIKTEEVIPNTYKAGDDKDSREYTFEYANGSIGCNYTRMAYDGIKKTYLNEMIDTSGGWSMSNDDDAYLPGEKVKLMLAGNIDHFQRLTPHESGGAGTNTTGVAVWAYIGNTRTPFGNATSGVLESTDGKSVCRATISDGKINVSSATLEVSGVFGSGKDKEQKVLFVVVSNQGRIGGIKYIYEYAE